MKILNAVSLVVLFSSSLITVNAHANEVCRMAESDADGDGWGWEAGASCRVTADTGRIPELTHPRTGQPINLERIFWVWEDFSGKTINECQGYIVDASQQRDICSTCQQPAATLFHGTDGNGLYTRTKNGALNAKQFPGSTALFEDAVNTVTDSNVVTEVTTTDVTEVVSTETTQADEACAVVDAEDSSTGTETTDTGAEEVVDSEPTAIDSESMTNSDLESTELEAAGCEVEPADQNNPEASSEEIAGESGSGTVNTATNGEPNVSGQVTQRDETSETTNPLSVVMEGNDSNNTVGTDGQTSGAVTVDGDTTVTTTAVVTTQTGAETTVDGTVVSETTVDQATGATDEQTAGATALVIDDAGNPVAGTGLAGVTTLADDSMFAAISATFDWTVDNNGLYSGGLAIEYYGERTEDGVRYWEEGAGDQVGFYTLCEIVPSSMGQMTSTPSDIAEGNNEDAPACIDTDGDGWGWDGGATCIP